MPPPRPHTPETPAPPVAGQEMRPASQVPPLSEHRVALLELLGLQATVKSAAEKLAEVARAEASAKQDPASATRGNDGSDALGGTTQTERERLTARFEEVGDELEDLLVAVERIWVEVGGLWVEMEQRAMEVVQSSQERRRAKATLEELSMEKERLVAEMGLQYQRGVQESSRKSMNEEGLDSIIDKFQSILVERNRASAEVGKVSRVVERASKHLDGTEKEHERLILDLERVVSEKQKMESDARKLVAETGRLRAETEKLRVEVDQIRVETEFDPVARD
ncbi:hypothetical protein DFP73DRAFT_588776 [Morchella snyderi]|nr:hypothetical protein DFP73DRAFT_588776 [Morchella snyderi]